MPKSKLLKKSVKSVNDVIKISDVNDLLDSISDSNVKDIAVIYRTKEGKVVRGWVGDELALMTMTDWLAEEIRGGGEPCP